MTVELPDFPVPACNAHRDRLEPRIESRIMPKVSHVLATEPRGERRARSPMPGGACVVLGMLCYTLRDRPLATFRPT